MTRPSSTYHQLLACLDDVDSLQHQLSAETTKDLDLSSLITRLDDVKNVHARLKELAADVNQIAERLSSTLVPAAMQATGFSSVNHAVGRVSVGSRVSASMVEKTGAMAWLRSHALGDLIIATVNAQTLSKVAKDRLEAGEELPAEHFKVNISTYTTITKPGEKPSRKFRPIDQE